MTTVNNIKKSGGYGVYIGRAGHGHDGYFGNPHPLGYCRLCLRVHDREDSIAEFTSYFKTRMKNDPVFKTRVETELRDQVLGCFCKPLSCHGDVYAEYLNAL